MGFKFLKFLYFTLSWLLMLTGEHSSITDDKNVLKIISFFTLLVNFSFLKVFILYAF